MDDDDESPKRQRRSCGRHCDQARRLMRVSTTPPTNDFERGGSNELTNQFWSSKKKSKEKEPCEQSQATKSGVPCEITIDGRKYDPCDDEYMLRYLHRLKQFIRRALNYAWCYTQYCYPGLRTAEYYKKVKRVCQEREKTKKKEAKNKKKTDKKKVNYDGVLQDAPFYLAVAGDKLRSDSWTQTSDEVGLSILDEDDDPDDGELPEVKNLKHLTRPLKILPAIEEELGWGQRLFNHIQNLSRTIVHSINDADQNQIGTILKVMCVLLAPAVMWLGANYMFLKGRYKSLSGKLKRVKEENDLLKKECTKLATVLSSTEKLKMPFSSKGSRQQVVAEFTRLAESRMKSKKEITRLTTEKAALLEELKMAKKQRDLARSQYTSITQGVLDDDTVQYVQTHDPL